MINFLIKQITKSIFYPQNMGLVIIRLIYLVIVTVYGAIAVFILNTSSFSSSENILDFQKTINMIFIILITLRNILPIYNTRNDLIPRYFPVSFFKRMSIEIIRAIYTPIAIYLLVFLVILSFSSAYSILNILVSMTLIFVSFLIELNFKKILEKRYQSKLILAVLFVCLVSFFVHTTLSFEGVEQLSYSISFLFIFFFFQLYLESYQKEIKYVLKEKVYKYRNIYTRFIFSRDSLRISTMMAIIFKSLLLLSFIVTFIKKGETENRSEFILHLFLFPIIYFTYIFNNYFGYCREFWLTFSLSNNFKKFAVSYLQPIVFILIFDFIISIIAAKFLNFDYLEFSIKYILISLMLLLNGFMGSFISPKRIDSKISFNSMKSNTSLIFSVLSIAMVIITTIESFTLMIVLSLVILILQLSVCLSVYKRKRANLLYSFYDKIF